MFRQRLLVAVLTTFAFVSSARAEKANMSREQLRETATHVVTGQVTAIYERTETAGNWKYTRYVAELRADGVEKGTGIGKGDLVYARYWRRSWIGNAAQPTDTGGHRGLPSVEDSIRVYLARNAYDGFDPDNKDGGFNVIGANGFEKLDTGSGK